MRRALLALVLVACTSETVVQADYAKQQEEKVAVLERELAACRDELAKVKPADEADASTKPAEPCTLGWLRSNHPDKITKVEQWLGEERAERTNELAALAAAKKLAGELPRQPVSLPALPMGALVFDGSIPEDCPLEIPAGSLATEFCEPTVTTCIRAIPEQRESFEASWRQLVAFMGMEYAAAEEPQNPREDYEDAGDFFCDFMPGIEWTDEGAAFLGKIREQLLGVAEDETKLKAFAGWVEPFALRLVPESVQPRLRRLVANLWEASHADLRALKAEVEKPETGASFLYSNGKKLEGLFLRRWMKLSGEAAADQMVLVYRFWLIRAAVALKMEQTVSWASELVGNLESTTTLKHRAWYRAELGKIK